MWLQNEKALIEEGGKSMWMYVGLEWLSGRETFCWWFHLFREFFLHLNKCSPITIYLALPISTCSHWGDYLIACSPENCEHRKCHNVKNIQKTGDRKNLNRNSSKMCIHFYLVFIFTWILHFNLASVRPNQQSAAELHFGWLLVVVPLPFSCFFWICLEMHKQTLLGAVKHRVWG